MGVIVAVDGPAGSGKSSVSRAAAVRLGYGFLDTGASYRALAWAVLEAGADVQDPAAVAAVLGRIVVDSALDPDERWVRVDGVDVTTAVRTSRTTAAVSGVAKVPAVRERLNDAFRARLAAAEPGVVVEGRDITTVVAPDAEVRVLLTADAETRAARRAAELPAEDASDVAAAMAERDARDSRVVDFLEAAPGVTTLDSTDLDFDGTVDALVALVRRAAEPGTGDGAMSDEHDYDGEDDLVERVSSVDEAAADRRAAALLAGLSDYDLEDEDRALLTAGLDGAIDAEPGGAPPVLAIVGRPNVGKSALVNRILGRRAAVVEDVPGVTRDRVTYRGEWEGRDFTLVDTGGWEPDASGLNAAVAAQAEVAIDLADAVLFVVDATVGATAVDERVVRLLRSTRKPVRLVANKVDGDRQELLIHDLWGLGLGAPWPVSALHGRGVADLLDEAMRMLPAESAIAQPEAGGPRRVALVGRPNVGKSSLLNKAAREDRVVVSELAGTTRDPVDEQIEIAGRIWRFVDTAGIRRRTHLSQGADFYASLRTQAALERAEVAVVLIDVTQPISEQDVRIVDMVLESGRALVLAFNKWDLLDDERRRYLEREIEQDLGHVAWAPRVNLSARTGRHLERLVPALDAALEGWDTRVGTGRFNAFIAELTAAHPHPVRGGKQPRILFGTQAGSRPPTFVLFTTGFLDAGYRRYVQRRLRELYGFVGTPIVVNMRVRERRPRP